jgi:uncharacterized protein (UPF0210 family)
VGIDILGGFSADVSSGMTCGDQALIDAIPRALNCTQKVCASVNVGTTRSGINMDAVVQLGQTIKDLAEGSAETGGFAAAKFVVFTNQAGRAIPSWPGQFTGVGQPERCDQRGRQRAGG